MGRTSEALAAQRDAWRQGRDRPHMVAITFQAAPGDEEFQALTAEADAARDRGDWAGAAGLYERALALHPLHYGYRVQAGHMLKEQERFAAAEIHYRTALALGAPGADVLRHLAFVCQRQGYHGSVEARPAAGGSAPLMLAPTAVEIETLAYVFWHEPHPSQDDQLRLLRDCATCEDVAVRMIADDRFAPRNRLLLELLGAKASGGKP